MIDADMAAMQRLAEGEDLALNEIMARWQQRIASFLLKMTGNRATACDLAQETFVRLYTSRVRYKQTGSFAGYLFQIAANLARNHRRSLARRPEQSFDTLAEEDFDFASDAPAPDQSLVNGEAAREVRHAIRQLPEELREALVLFTYDNLGYAEIAAIAGCSPKAVETRIYRARQLLKQSLSHLAGRGLDEDKTTEAIQ